MLDVFGKKLVIQILLNARKVPLFSLFSAVIIENDQVKYVENFDSLIFLMILLFSQNLLDI